MVEDRSHTMLSRITFCAGLLSLLYVQASHADILATATRRSYYEILPPLSFFHAFHPVSLNENGDKYITFVTEANGSVVSVLYNAECRIMGRPYTTLILQMIVKIDGKGVDKLSQDALFCRASGSMSVGSYAKQVLFTVGKAGVHQVSIEVRINRHGRYYLDDSSLVVYK
jgi:hypothetical protein